MSTYFLIQRFTKFPSKDGGNGIKNIIPNFYFKFKNIPNILYWQECGFWQRRCVKIDTKSSKAASTYSQNLRSYFYDKPCQTLNLPREVYVCRSLIVSATCELECINTLHILGLYLIMAFQIAIALGNNPEWMVLCIVSPFVFWQDQDLVWEMKENWMKNILGWYRKN